MLGGTSIAVISPGVTPQFTDVAGSWHINTVPLGGVDVTGLSAVSVSSVEQLVSATGTNTINAGSRVTIVSTNNSSAVDVEFTIILEAV